MEEELCGAAVVGNVLNLQEIITKEPHILHRISAQNFITTPLHVASMLGHVDLVRLLLSISPDLSGVVDQRRRSALHLAAEKGHIEVVKALMDLEEHGVQNSGPHKTSIISGPALDMCTSVDEDGRNSLHVAAMKGKHGVLEVLMGAVGSDVAQERVRNGQTILHLCVLYRQRETLNQLLDSDCQELINAVDEWGNTILHLAVADKQFEIVKKLASFKCKGNYEKMDLNVKNSNGYTALDILLNSIPEKETEDKTNRIKLILLGRKAKRAKDLIKTEWLTEKRESLMIVAVLIAAMAFQAGVSPPGGIWQDNTTEHNAGETVMAYNYHHYYPYFLRANTVGFVASSSIIFLLLSDLPFRKKTIMWLLVLVMWLTITSMAFTYAFAITVITPRQLRPSLTRTIVVAVIVWCSVMSILLIVHSFRLMKKLVEEKVENRHEYIVAMRALRNRPIQLLSGIRRSFGNK